jgi:hypothetical protein
MKRLIITGLVLVSTIALAQEPAKTNVVLRLDCSGSVSAALRAHQISAIRISGSSDSNTFDVETSDPEITTDIAPGKWKLRAELVMGEHHYAVEPPEGTEIDVPAMARFEAQLPVHALVLTGRVTPAFKGQMNVMPSYPKPGSWGFAIPFDDEGRFAVPMPSAGQWDLDVWKADHTHVTLIPEFEFSDRDDGREVEIRLPAGSIAGKIVDAEGQPIAGATVRATLVRETTHRQIEAKAVSGEDGQFALENLIAGKWNVYYPRQDKPVRIVVSADSREDVVLTAPKR